MTCPLWVRTDLGQETTTFSSFVVVETTAQLRISGNRQLAVSY